jgi:hypothetical protein
MSDIRVRPSSVYRKLAEGCLLEAESAPPALRNSLINLAKVYIRTADTIDLLAHRGPTNSIFPTRDQSLSLEQNHAERAVPSGS